MENRLSGSTAARGGHPRETDRSVEEFRSEPTGAYTSSRGHAVQQHLSFAFAIFTLGLAACAEGTTTFGGNGSGAAASGGNGDGAGAGTPGNGGNGDGAGMTSSMGGDGHSTSTNTSTSTGGVQCGDGTCSPGEICSSCPADCGSCCGNGVCDPGETTASCVADCPNTCGNGTCDGTETEATCPQDCGTSDCPHDPCSTGGALAPDECNGCPFIVCTAEPQCCILSWGSECVAEAQGNPLCGC
jgi:hypothetical protein